MIEQAIEGHKESNQARLKESGSITNDIDVEEIIDTDINELTIEEYEEKATEGIMTFLKSPPPGFGVLTNPVQCYLTT